MSPDDYWTQELYREELVHNHVSKGPPYNHTAPITCRACKVWLKERLIENFRKSCEKYGTNFDLRIIADMLAVYDFKETDT